LHLLVRRVNLAGKQATSKQKKTLNFYQTTRRHIRKIALFTVSDVRILNLIYILVSNIIIIIITITFSTNDDRVFRCSGKVSDS
jgi:hypothetical protein